MSSDTAKPIVGIAITTFNRSDLVADLVTAIRATVDTPIEIVICDDGSSDDTVAMLRARGERVVTGRNRGIAWNKNRGIFYLLHKTKCDIILLLDDDVVPSGPGWLAQWIEAAQRFGHINYSFPDYRFLLLGGEGTAAIPGLTHTIGGCALAFRRDVLASLGYMDLRFGRYGHEHSDLSIRAVRAGHGGLCISEDGSNPYTVFFVIDGGLTSRAAPSTGTQAEIDANGPLLIALSQEQLYRHAWRDDAERKELLAEMDQSVGGQLVPDNHLDKQSYLALHEDVAAAEQDPVMHYLYYGVREGRKLRD